MHSKLIKKLIFFILPIFFLPVQADVVKPALIEISVNKQGQVDIEIRASIEALLTGINGRYKNTKDAPNADQYDVLRKMQDVDLAIAFDKFKPEFLNKIRLSNTKNKRVTLIINKVDIPEPGYTKVPRISTIELTGKIDTTVQSVQWYYPLAFGDNVVKLRQADVIAQKYHWSEVQWLRKDQPSEAFSLTEIVARKPIIETIKNYIVWGFEHIFPKGIDHILFILGLFLFSYAIKPLLSQVTMFTIAHTITLGLAMNGVISLPSYIVEPLIALSIVYVGVENIVANLYAKPIRTSRLFLVFGFGLLHGLGFASMLGDFGMPDDAFTTALISFNVGVELGQLTIIIVAFLMLGVFWFLLGLIEKRRNQIINKKAYYKKFIAIPASVIIALIAFYWFIERLDLNYLV